MLNTLILIALVISAVLNIALAAGVYADRKRRNDRGNKILNTLRQLEDAKARYRDMFKDPNTSWSESYEVATKILMDLACQHALAIADVDEDDEIDRAAILKLVRGYLNDYLSIAMSSLGDGDEKYVAAVDSACMLHEFGGL